MLVEAGLLLWLCTQLLRLVRLRTGLPRILVVGDSRPVNLNDPPTFARRLSPARAGLCFGHSRQPQSLQQLPMVREVRSAPPWGGHRTAQRDRRKRDQTSTADHFPVPAERGGRIAVLLGLIGSILGGARPKGEPMTVPTR